MAVDPGAKKQDRLLEEINESVDTTKDKIDKYDFRRRRINIRYAPNGDPIISTPEDSIEMQFYEIATVERKNGSYIYHITPPFENMYYAINEVTNEKHINDASREAIEGMLWSFGSWINEHSDMIQRTYAEYITKLYPGIINGYTGIVSFEYKPNTLYLVNCPYATNYNEIRYVPIPFFMLLPLEDLFPEEIIDFKFRLDEPDPDPSPEVPEDPKIPPNPGVPGLSITVRVNGDLDDFSEIAVKLLRAPNDAPPDLLVEYLTANLYFSNSWKYTWSDLDSEGYIYDAELVDPYPGGYEITKSMSDSGSSRVYTFTFKRVTELPPESPDPDDPFEPEIPPD